MTPSASPRVLHSLTACARTSGLMVGLRVQGGRAEDAQRLSARAPQLDRLHSHVCFCGRFWIQGHTPSASPRVLHSLTACAHLFGLWRVLLHARGAHAASGPVMALL